MLRNHEHESESESATQLGDLAGDLVADDVAGLDLLLDHGLISVLRSCSLQRRGSRATQCPTDRHH